MDKFTEEQKFLRAKTKVDNLRSFYIHLIVYLFANTVITVIKIGRNLHNGETLGEAIFDFATVALWLTWGMAIAFHAFYVYGFDYFFGRNWEEERLRQYMDEEEEHLKHYN